MPRVNALTAGAAPQSAMAFTSAVTVTSADALRIITEEWSMQQQQPRSVVTSLYLGKYKFWQYFGPENLFFF